MLKCLAERAEQILDDSSPDKPSSTTPSKSTSSTMISVTLQLKKGVRHPFIHREIPSSNDSPNLWMAPIRTEPGKAPPELILLGKMMIHQWIVDRGP